MPDGNGEMPQDQTDETQTASWDEWLSEQDEAIQNMADGHIAGLKSALESERTQRKDLMKQLRTLEGQAEKGSAAQEALSELTAKLETAERQAAFYRDAATPEIGCSNPKAAFLVAQASGLFKRSGDPDWAAIRAEAPELFRVRGTANGGAGTTSPPRTGPDMNAYIRAAAGRG